MMTWRPVATALVLASAVCFGHLTDIPLSYPSLNAVEKALHTTAHLMFEGVKDAYSVATKWDRDRLQGKYADRCAPYFACAEYANGQEAFSQLKGFLASESVRHAALSPDVGACFVATASLDEFATISADPSRFGLLSIGPFLSTLKLAPGLLEHTSGNETATRLSTSHGRRMRMDSVDSFNVALSPGTMSSFPDAAFEISRGLLDDLLSPSTSLHSVNMWSDPALAGHRHLSTSGAAMLRREWTRAADVVHELSEEVDSSPGDICSWHSVMVRLGGKDLLVISGIEHLLHGGRGVGGQGDEATELHVACFMGLISYLSSLPEVLRISPNRRIRLYNKAARANVQSATVDYTPLTDVGLDGTDQVIQILDTGLDETSCYFEDGDGDTVEHGYYFEELGFATSITTSATTVADDQIYDLFSGGDFRYDKSRRKIIQYIELVKSDDASHSSVFTTSRGGYGYYIPADVFEQDEKAGHGTHTAGTAAGATINSPADTISCDFGYELGCAGGCVLGEGSFYDDLVSYYTQRMTDDLDRLCSDYDCNGFPTEVCLDDDRGVTLADHGGVAQGAKLSIFDIFYFDAGLGDYAGNGLWEACMEAGCKLHSNSWGIDYFCEVADVDLEYDRFMYENSENLLIFAAGNDGDINDGRSVCTIGSPAIAKNVLAVGATSSGETRLTSTGQDEGWWSSNNGWSDIDTVAVFSSYGPTQDGRIKPEVVAPGDMIYSATSDGTDEYSCRIWAYSGTSMACPAVAGAAAMVRQYFIDTDFYASDVEARGICGGDFICAGFNASSATVKALLINSANLMGGSSEPDGERGFGRIHLAAGMPIGGEGDMALFVADAASTDISGQTKQDYLFQVNADANLDFRATLSWIDPPALTVSGKQLIHDLDLAVFSPNETRYTMWESGYTDETNVNERVIVDAADVTSGTWTVRVWAKALSESSTQAYSLVVNGAISPVSEDGAVVTSSTTDSTTGSGDSSISPLDPGVESDASGDEDAEDAAESSGSTTRPRSVVWLLSCLISYSFFIAPQ